MQIVKNSIKIIGTDMDTTDIICIIKSFIMSGKIYGKISVFETMENEIMFYAADNKILDVLDTLCKIYPYTTITHYWSDINKNNYGVNIYINGKCKYKIKNK